MLLLLLCLLCARATMMSFILEPLVTLESAMDPTTGAPIMKRGPGDINATEAPMFPPDGPSGNTTIFWRNNRNGTLVPLGVVNKIPQFAYAYATVQNEDTLQVLGTTSFEWETIVQPGLRGTASLTVMSSSTFVLENELNDPSPWILGARSYLDDEHRVHLSTTILNSHLRNCTAVDRPAWVNTQLANTLYAWGGCPQPFNTSYIGVRVVCEDVLGNIDSYPGLVGGDFNGNVFEPSLLVLNRLEEVNTQCLVVVLIRANDFRASTSFAANYSLNTDAVSPVRMFGIPWISSFAQIIQPVNIENLPSVVDIGFNNEILQLLYDNLENQIPIDDFRLAFEGSPPACDGIFSRDPKRQGLYINTTNFTGMCTLTISIESTRYDDDVFVFQRKIDLVFIEPIFKRDVDDQSQYANPRGVDFVPLPSNHGGRKRAQPDGLTTVGFTVSMVQSEDPNGDYGAVTGDLYTFLPVLLDYNPEDWADLIQEEYPDVDDVLACEFAVGLSNLYAEKPLENDCSKEGRTSAEKWAIALGVIAGALLLLIVVLAIMLGLKSSQAKAATAGSQSLPPPRRTRAYEHLKGY